MRQTAFCCFLFAILTLFLPASGQSEFDASLGDKAMSMEEVEALINSVEIETEAGFCFGDECSKGEALDDLISQDLTNLQCIEEVTDPRCRDVPKELLRDCKEDYTVLADTALICGERLYDFFVGFIWEILIKGSYSLIVDEKSREEAMIFLSSIKNYFQLEWFKASKESSGSMGALLALSENLMLKLWGMAAEAAGEVWFCHSNSSQWAYFCAFAAELAAGGLTLKAVKTLVKGLKPARAAAKINKSLSSSKEISGRLRRGSAVDAPSIGSRAESIMRRQIDWQNSSLSLKKAEKAGRTALKRRVPKADLAALKSRLQKAYATGAPADEVKKIFQEGVEQMAVKMQKTPLSQAAAARIGPDLSSQLNMSLKELENFMSQAVQKNMRARTGAKTFNAKRLWKRVSEEDMSGIRRALEAAKKEGASGYDMQNILKKSINELVQKHIKAL